MKKQVPNLQMILVCGPLVNPESIQAAKGVTVRGYVPNLFEHLAAADLCIVAGGGTITLELTALQKPFLYFPLEQHFEQEVDVANRCKRHGAGVKMRFSETTLNILVEKTISNMGKNVQYAEIPTSGAEKAGQLLREMLQ
jgi:UDP-N-acetylglucosamine:LPS N-acetylglucosamine transferase